MKRITVVRIALALAALAGAIVYAAPDVEPVRSIYQQFRHMVPQHFEKEVNFVFIDGGQFGTVKASYVDAGNVNVVGRIWTNVLDAGAANVGTLGVTGVATSATVKADLLDAGNAHFNGAVTVIEGLSVGKCTLNGASPSVCTDTVRAGVHCVCTNVGGSAAIAANGVACDVASTTLTATSANGATNVVNWHCF